MNEDKGGGVRGTCPLPPVVVAVAAAAVVDAEEVVVVGVTGTTVSVDPKVIADVGEVTTGLVGAENNDVGPYGVSVDLYPAGDEENDGDEDEDAGDNMPGGTDEDFAGTPPTPAGLYRSGLPLGTYSPRYVNECWFVRLDKGNGGETPTTSPEKG